MRIPIKAVRELCVRLKLGGAIIFGCDADGKRHHVATWGRTTEESERVAAFGNRLKKTLGWPDSLYAEPSRVRRLVRKIAELEAKLAIVEPLVEAAKEVANGREEGGEDEDFIIALDELVHQVRRVREAREKEVTP